MRRTHRLIAAAVFLSALGLYVLTMARTTSLWDAGEFIASANGLQVMHPPGSPVYMLVSRLFAMFVPAAYVALAVNFVSVLASAVTVLLVYLIVVRLAAWGRGPAVAASPSAYGAARIGGIVAACTFAVTDSFWFNAVEAEVYALSMCLTALVVWLGLVWSDRVRADATARRFGGPHDRLLVLIAYVFGLAVGVHLMALLTFFTMALLIYFARVERPRWSRSRQALGLVIAGGVAVLAFGVVYPGVVIWLPDLAERSGAPLLVLLVGTTVLVVGLLVTRRRGLAATHLVLLCLTTVLVGASAYALIPIRSAADPVIDLNDPETVEALVPYLKREQYGQRDLLYGPTYDNRIGRLDPDRNRVFFPRRNTWDPAQEALYGFYASDADYFWRYQLGHMYARYFLWNFAGRAKDEQGARWVTGVSDRESEAYVYATPSEAASRNTYFALPLLLGLVGLCYHVARDWRRALSLLALFLATSVGLVVYLNEVPLTPRERDYIYVASFFTFSLWVGLGAVGLLGDLRNRLLRHRPVVRRSTLIAASAVLFLAVPGRMLVQNYDDHDRSGRLLARDFAYNMLMSLDENAILFTEGDNDTYPLWYVQEVEGVRRDVRVVCLSLLQTPWYARQLRDQSAYEAAPLPISLTDEELNRLRPEAWQPTSIQLPVDVERLVQQTELRTSVEDTSGFDSPMTWTLHGRPYAADLRVLYPVDVVVLDLLATNARQGWERPVYFAGTTAPTSRLDLEPYLQREGLALRVVPIRHEEPFGRIVPDLMLRRLSAFRFTGLSDPDVYFDPYSRGMAGNHYRNVFSFTAAELLKQGRPAEARGLLDAMLDAVPPDTIPLTFAEAYPLTQVYEALGEEERTIALWHYAEPYLLRSVRAAASSQQLESAVRQVQAVQRSYIRARAFGEAAALSSRLADLLGDEAFRQPPSFFEQLYDELQAPSPAG